MLKIQTLLLLAKSHRFTLQLENRAQHKKQQLSDFGKQTKQNRDPWEEGTTM